MNFSNLKIGTRLIVNSSLTLLLLIVLIIVGLRGIHQLDTTEDDVYQSGVKSTLATEFLGLIETNSEALRALISLNDANEQKTIEDEINQRSSRSQVIINNLVKQPSQAEGMALLSDMVKKLAIYRDARSKFQDSAIKTGDENRREAIRIMNAEVAPALQTLIVTADKFKKYQDQISSKDNDISNQATKTAYELMIIIGVVAVTLGIILSWIITRSIIRPINYAVKIAETVAHGDLTQRIEAKTQDETGILLRALRDMNDSLTKTVSNIRVGAETISSASSQIAAGNQDLSSRTEEQASSLEETAASTEELASTVRQNADNARQANQLAVRASEVASRGGSAVDEVVETMNAITLSSSKISEIVSVIDGIAFQTNILALNAAVEAARAGEQGKGFAVVAGEVRTLAQRSANAAKEIKQLIEDSTAKVGIGADQVKRAGETMRDLVASVKRVADIVGEITAASDEQSTGIDQINRAVSQMDEVTQQNAALVEEAAAAASSLEEQAQQLAQAVSVFKLRDGGEVIDVAARQVSSKARRPADPKLSTKSVAKSVQKDEAAAEKLAQLTASRRKSTIALAGEQEAWESF